MQRKWLAKKCSQSDKTGIHFNRVLGSVHTSTMPAPEEFEIAALFQRLSLLSTRIRHENEAFQLKTLSLQTGGIWKRAPVFSFRVHEN